MSFLTPQAYAGHHPPSQEPSAEVQMPPPMPTSKRNQQPEYPELDPKIAFTVLVIILAGWLLWKKFQKK